MLGIFKSYKLNNTYRGVGFEVFNCVVTISLLVFSVVTTLACIPHGCKENHLVLAMWTDIPCALVLSINWISGNILYMLTKPKGMGFEDYLYHSNIFLYNRFNSGTPLYRIEEYENPGRRSHYFILNYSNDNGKTWRQYKKNGKAIEFYNVDAAKSEAEYINKMLSANYNTRKIKVYECSYD